MSIFFFFILLLGTILHSSAHDDAKFSKKTKIPNFPSKQKSLIFTDQRLAAIYPVIQKFKSTITSDPRGITKTWTGADICSYKGFFCDHPPDNKSAMAVASVDFNGFHLSAPSLENFLDKLPDIALFHANSNNFSGSLSPNIAKLKYLYELDISNNQFTGQFPSTVLGMNGLEFLDIRFNLFTGSVPAQIFTQNLYALFLNDNNFMMQLPENISISRLLFVTFANNKFNGPIPKSIFKALSSLSEVLFLNDSLTGCLPYEIGLLKEAVVLDVGNNQLTGPLPFSLACLEKAEQINFAGNFLIGMVPEVVCGLPNLANLSLSDNYFTQIGPLCWFMVKKGIVDVRNNCIPGFPEQRSIQECAEFFAYPRFCPRMWSYVFIPCHPYHDHFPSSFPGELAPSPH